MRFHLRYISCNGYILYLRQYSALYRIFSHYIKTGNVVAMISTFNFVYFSTITPVSRELTVAIVTTHVRLAVICYKMNFVIKWHTSEYFT